MTIVHVNSDEYDIEPDNEDIVLIEEETQERREYLPLERSKSRIWEHFGFLARDGKYCEPDKKKRRLVYCKVCECSYKYCGNTTNMCYHLKEHHPTLYKALSDADSSSSSSTHVASVPRGQQKLPELFRQQEAFPRSSSKWIKLTESLCYFLAKDTLPFNTVNGSGFQKFLLDLEPRYKPPDRKTISTVYMPKLYKGKKESIRQGLRSCKAFGFTTDMWTSRSTHSYVSFTVHFISDEYHLKHHLLETKEFTEAHTAENIADEMTSIITEWELESADLIAATTDNASNIKAALDILQCLHMPCFSHVLNLAVEKAMAVPGVSRALARCRQLTSHFHRSTNASYVLKRKQADLHSVQHNLLHDVVTRWNWSYYMVKRVVEQQQPICAALLELRTGELMPSDHEFAAMSDFLTVMEPFVQITEALGGEEWITITMVQPLLHKLLNVHLNISPSESRIIKTMKKAMFDNLSNRYTGPILSLLTKACFLDPRLKLPAFMSQNEKDELISDIESELEEIEHSTMGTHQNVSPTTGITHASQGRKTPKGEHLLLSLVSDIVASGTGNSTSDVSEKSISEKIHLEIIRYRSEALAELDYKNANTLLQWWKINCSRFPFLAKLVPKYLLVPATSVPSERAFSCAGHIVSDRRACLLPANVNMLVFLAENL